MDIEHIRALAALAETGQLSALELRSPQGRLRLEGTGSHGGSSSTSPAPAAGAAAAAANSQPAIGAGAAVQARAGGFGYFTTRHPSRATALVSEGGAVTGGQILGLIRSGPLYLPVTSQAAGTARRLVDDDTLVGFGTPLFDIG